MAKFKKGDRVRVKDKVPSGSGVPSGAYATIDEENSTVPWCILDEPAKDGKKQHVLDQDWLEPATEKPTAADCKHPSGNYKIGTVVRVTVSSYERLVGCIGTVQEDDMTHPWVHFDDLNQLGITGYDGNHPGCEEQCRAYGVGSTEPVTSPDPKPEPATTYTVISEAHELLETIQSDKEITPMESIKKLYRLKENTSLLEEGAILKRVGSAYEPVEAIWDTELGKRYRRELSGTIQIKAFIVENDNERFEEIYESTLGKAKFLTKDAAKAAYAAVFATKKSK